MWWDWYTKLKKTLKASIHLARYWYYYLLGIIIVIFCWQRLAKLQSIPVFVDEAIYIYWSQLAISDWQQYSFFALNDGKTPLVIWTAIPLIKIFADPLVAGRVAAILFGLGQLLVTIYMVKVFVHKRRYQLLAGLLVIFSPGLMLTNRLALMDSAVSFFISLTFILTYQATGAYLSRDKDKNSWYWWTLAAGTSWGLAMWTKFSCLLLAPVLATVPFYHAQWSKIKNKQNRESFWRSLASQLMPLFVISAIGVIIFAVLKISPAFPMLFSRGGDFLYSVGDFLRQPFAILTYNVLNFARVITNYTGLTMTVTTLCMALIYVCRRRSRTALPLLILISGFAYALPIIMLGKVVYPRYFLPVVPFIIVSFVVCLSLIRRIELINFKLALILIVLVTGHYWSWRIHTNPFKLPLLPADRQQLFWDWSSGHGIKQTAEYLQELAASKKLLVLTEGFVGTLPDGLQIYLWKSSVRDNIKVLGLGAPPIHNFDKLSPQPNWDEYDEVLLVANSHRLDLDEDIKPVALVQEYERPQADAPTLQVWRLK